MTNDSVEVTQVASVKRSTNGVARKWSLVTESKSEKYFTTYFKDTFKLWQRDLYWQPLLM